MAETIYLNNRALQITVVTKITLVIIQKLYFVSKKYDESFELLIESYPKNKDRVKKQLLDFFEALGGSNEKTVHYRKKLSSIMFS